jgi:demethylmenaquinone methyltransferase/2-methoxy-6-polyprenyl-1,4-benzoquinol methylase
VSSTVSRVTRSKEDARASYDRLSRWYDALAHASEWPFTARGLRMLQVQAGEAVLEIGCGTGHALAQIAPAAGRAYGLDLSAGMLAVARRRVAAGGAAGRAHLVQGDAAHLPYAEASFDALLMSFTLELFDTPTIPVVLAECWRVLRPGGRLGLVALAQADRPAVRLYEWAHRRFPRAVDCRPIHAAAALQDAGFQLAARERGTMWGLPVEMVVGSLARR